MGLFGGLGRVIGFLWWFLKAVSPYLWQGIVQLLRAAGYALAALLTSMWEKSAVMASYWQEQIIFNEPRLSPHDSLIWYLARFVGLATLVIGWIILSYITVFLVSIIF